nr:hypothetical protein [Phytomonospora endophytica]
MSAPARTVIATASEVAVTSPASAQRRTLPLYRAKATAATTSATVAMTLATVCTSSGNGSVPACSAALQSLSIEGAQVSVNGPASRSVATPNTITPTQPAKRAPCEPFTLRIATVPAMEPVTTSPIRKNHSCGWSSAASSLT